MCVGDPEYDPRTLFIPKWQWQKFTPFEKQFWEIKCRLYDTIVFFKKGKFYELYENDADVGSREFDLKMIDRINMRMVGVPEATFEMWAARFVAAGYKIARVDQTETAIGKSIRERESEVKADKIIKRELSCILTAGTVTEPSMIGSDAASYFLVLKEMAIGDDRVHFGVVLIDAAGGQFQLCDFYDDSSRTLLETLLMQVQPKEILLERGNVSAGTARALKALVPSCLITEAAKDKEYWGKSKIVNEIDMGRYFDDGCWPEILRKAYEDDCLSFLAFGASLWYLKELKLDRSLLSFKNIIPLDPLKSATSMVLDGQTLLNLDILPSSLRTSTSVVDPRKGTLLGVLDHCSTAFGRRLLQVWICHPLRDVKEINQRLDVVDFLSSHTEIVNELNEKLRLLPDLERNLSRIHSGSIKLKDFISTIDAFSIILLIVERVRRDGIAPSLLTFIIDQIPEYSSTVEFFKSAFDRQLALKEGVVVPFAGVEKDYDDANAKFLQIKDDFDRYLVTQEKVLKIRGAKYKDVGKEIFQLEIPANTAVPKDYVLMSKTKTVKRYWTSEIKEMVKDYQEWDERRSAVLRNVYGKMLKSFDSHITIWRSTVASIAKLDCLLSLTKASQEMREPKCRPHIVNSPSAMCDIQELRHPCISADRVASFIPNDITLGSETGQNCTDHMSRMILLTGPNMGGKSTLLRQTCLAIIMAQIGCYVTASKCQISPVDRIFTRLGANDNIIAGQSTFMVELLDTAKILREATERSLVILDELGRGTSTFDGMAIAHAVLLQLARRTRCIGLFATHYRPLAVDFFQEPSVSCQYMSCALEADSKRVTFLYKLALGISPKSYGMNVAAMAGLPNTVVSEAESIADQFDQSLCLSIESRLHSKSRKLSRLLVEMLCKSNQAS